MWKIQKKLKIKKSIIVVIGVQYAIQGVKMRLWGFGVRLARLLSLFFGYILFYYLIWFESLHFSSTLMILNSNVEEESLPPMWLCLYLGTCWFGKIKLYYPKLYPRLHFTP